MEKRIAKRLTARKRGALVKGQGVYLQVTLAAQHQRKNQGAQERAVVVVERMSQHQ